MKIPENIVPLVDGDWIVYMSCSAIEYRWDKAWREQCKDEGMEEPYPDSPTPPFNEIIDVFDNAIKDIKKRLFTEAMPLIFYTGDNNFRKDVAVSKVYKGNRSSEKPYFYHDLKTYISTKYKTYTENDLEADDLMAIWQTYFDIEGMTPSCIVTVDKDLRQVNGWHFSPEGHNYPSFGPRYCDDTNTYIEYKDPDAKSKKLIGTGFRFFYSQLITGDTVDNIPGLPGKGPAFALKVLGGCDTELKCFEAVREAYRDVCLMADDYLLEQAKLLWMVRGWDNDGEPVMWTPPS